MSYDLSIIIPAKNEANSLKNLIPEIKEIVPDAEIVVVNDGSTDDTRQLLEKFNIKTVNHPYSMGNGAAIKSGARVATGETIVTMDADGQHKPGDIPRMLDELEKGYDMVVGARSGNSQASVGRLLANSFYNKFASLIAGHDIRDLTSGFRAVTAEKFREFIHLFPNGFSYPTTVTMAFFRAGYTVSYLPITAEKRTGRSHIKPLQDGIRFLLIIFKIGTLYSPLKIFIPISLAFFLLATGYSGYTLSHGHFTNMSALLFSMSILTFLIGLVSEQITTLMYHSNKE